MRRQLPLLAFLSLASGCLSNIFGNSGTSGTTCSKDSDCPVGQSCFVDGCGKLGDDLVAEITSTSPTTSQDVALGHPRAGQILSIASAQALQLTVRRGSAPFPGELSLSASGASDLLPGVVRSTSAVQANVSGQLLLPISSGTYTVVVTPSDPTIPPVLPRLVTVDGGLTSLAVSLLPATEVQSLSGTALAAPAQPEPVPPKIQIFAGDGVPLSSIVSADSAGQFVVTVARDALDGGAGVLQTSPATNPATSAARAFPLPDATRFAQPFIIGDGVPTVQVSGRVLAQDGSPVSGASVLIEGTVAGGGTATAGPAITAADGTFVLTTLPENTSGSLRLWIFPPPASAAGLLRLTLDVPPGSNVSGSWTCPVRPLVQGAVVLPDGGPAASLTVRADPVGPAHADQPEPASGGAGTTDAAGRFAVRLDPALYRVEVQPSADLPVLRSFQRVTGSDVAPLQLVLKPGRRFTAQVRRDTGAGVPQALVRIYRAVTLDDGSQRAMPLSEGLTDASGQVEILLPTE
jgi:hypothetical protein